MPAYRAQANQGVGKVPKPIPASLWDTPARKHVKSLSRMARVRDQASHSGKQQTERPHSVHWWLSHQSPVRVGLHCQARCDYHPWRQCSLYGLNLQVVNRGGNSQTYSPLDCLKRWQTGHTCHTILTDSMSLLQKVKVEWEAQTGMCQWSTSTFENSCGCTALDILEWREMTEQIDWWARQSSQVACFSKDLKWWGAWNTTCGHKAKDIHTIDRLEETGVERGSATRKKGLIHTDTHTRTHARTQARTRTYTHTKTKTTKEDLGNEYNLQDYKRH